MIIVANILIGLGLLLLVMMIAGLFSGPAPDRKARSRSRAIMDRNRARMVAEGKARRRANR